jgi:hypothetical protein
MIAATPMAGSVLKKYSSRWVPSRSKVPAKTKPPVAYDGWRIPEPLWTRIVELPPPRPVHPLGCHNPASTTARPWTPSSSRSAPGASGTP